jgi:enoyl-[acyl-carrier-protein] reductase (NADH)
VDPIEGTELLFEMRTLPATNYFNGARGTVAVLNNITDLRHATEQVSQNVHRLQTAEEIAAAICWLLSEDAAAVTGEAVNTSAGQTMV